MHETAGLNQKSGALKHEIEPCFRPLFHVSCSQQNPPGPSSDVTIAGGSSATKIATLVNDDPFLAEGERGREVKSV